MLTNRSLIIYIVFLLAAMPIGSAAQLSRHFPLSSYQIVPLSPVETAKERDSELKSIWSTNGFRNANLQNTSHGQRRFDGTGQLPHHRIKADANDLITIPHWSDSFDYQGLTFKYTMVGADPQRGSGTTVVPTELIPLRFIFTDGTVFDASTDIFDGQTAIQGITRSPIFQNYDFVIGGTNVGNTQYGDAFQRANFWDAVSTRSPDYHVLLGQPVVFPVQTITVPADKGYTRLDGAGHLQGLVDQTFLYDQSNIIMARLNISPQTLPILVWGHVFGANGAGAWHGATPTSQSIQTWIGTGYDFQNPGGYGSDVYDLSHEIAEWMDDPFGNNFIPGWNIPFVETVERCDSGTGGLLETGDPVEFFAESAVALPATSFTYHVTEAMFIDFYTRSPRSRSVNGQYSLFEIGLPYGLPTLPSSECVGGVQVDQSFIDVPGASLTSARGLNNKGEVVGYYVGQNGARGFIWRGGSLGAIDYPGSRGTIPMKINDAGDIVGYFFDGSGLPHGFSYINGRWTRIDFPGSTDTVVNGINSSGDIVGEYDSTQPVTHGFKLRNGRFTRVDTSFAQQSEVTAINDSGRYVGDTWNDPVNGPDFGFTGSDGGLTMLNMPEAQFTVPTTLNNHGMIGGYFDNGDGYSSGFIQLFGFLHEVDNGRAPYIYVFGNNERDQIVGQVYDFSQLRFRGFIGALPLARNAH